MSSGFREFVSRFGEVVTDVVQGKRKEKGLSEDGSQFYPDPTPMAPPVGYVAQPSMFDIIRAQVRAELTRQGIERGVESFEEADDFEVGEDYEPDSPYEENFELSVRELVKIGNETLKERGMMVNEQGVIVPVASTGAPPAKPEGKSAGKKKASQAAPAAAEPPSVDEEE